MAKPRKPWFRGAVSLAVLVGLAATLIASPAISLTSKEKRQVKKIAKKQATKVFNDLIDPAIASGVANKQDKCADGTVLAYAFVDTEDTAFNTADVNVSFNCAGGPIEARENANGDYDVRIPGITTPSIGENNSIAANVTSGDNVDEFAVYKTSSDEDFIEVEIFNSAGALADGKFAIAVYNKG